MNNLPDLPPDALAGDEAVSLYGRVKQMIRARILSGEWPPRYRVPSENELVAQLGVSRMTVNRALRELAAEGVLVRVQGSGTFVAQGKGQSSLFVRNIAEEIASRGQRHSAEIVVLDQVKASPEMAESLEIALGAAVFHSIVLHHQDEVPVQIEDRFVDAVLVPGYGAQDFTRTTPNAYLSSQLQWTEAEHEIEAVLPAAWEAKLLSIGRHDPCLSMRRITWSGPKPVTVVRMLMPGSRYTLRCKHSAAATPHD